MQRIECLLLNNKVEEIQETVTLTKEDVTEAKQYESISIINYKK